jgi:beta-phosphoglucomutase-like phosphatase (HAD superfamily)
LYLRALSDLGAAPDEAVAIEDSPNGALAAKTAGMRVVVVPNELTAGFRFGEVDLRLASLADHSWQDIFRSLDRRQV